MVRIPPGLLRLVLLAAALLLCLLWTDGIADQVLRDMALHLLQRPLKDPHSRDRLHNPDNSSTRSITHIRRKAAANAFYK